MKSLLLFIGVGLLGWSLNLTGVEAGTVSIKGSNTFGEELGPALIDSFSQKNPGIEVALESRGSGSGIAALIAGECDIASSSRPLTEDEQRLAKSHNLRLEHHTVGYYGIAVVVGPQHPVKALTTRQIEDVFTGKISNWKDLGGPDLPIHLYIPDEQAGTRLGFRELAMSNNPYPESAMSKATYKEIADAVANDPQGIGYVSLPMMQQKGLQGILVNGIHPSSVAVIEGLYPFARMVRLFTVRGQLSEEARVFVRFVQSRSGQKVVDSVGFVPRMTPRQDWGGMAP